MTAMTTEGSPVTTSIERFGPATKRRVQGINVLTLKGSAYEMGRQHGSLLAEDIRRGPLPYYRTFIEKLFGGSRFGSAGVVAFNAMQRMAGARVERRMPAFVSETLQGLADGSDIPLRDIMEGATMPDSMVWLAARLMQLRGPGPAMGHRVALGLGCTSAVAWGDATRDGRLLHARNFDYHGVSVWPRTQTVFFYEPNDGQRYVSVGAAGVALGGITAMNEAGLSLTVHQHMFTDRAKLGGVPIGVMGDLVMRKAETLDDAARILASERPISCWTYVVTDGRRREVLCHEESPTRRVQLRLGSDKTTSTPANLPYTRDTFGYANIYLDRELGDTELDLYPSYWRHNRARFERAIKLLAERSGALDPRAMGGILADVGEGSCRVRGSIAMVLTVGSVVFRPEDGVVWVGTGEAPTSHNTFIPFSLKARGQAPEESTFAAKELRPSERAAFERYRRAYVAYVDEGDVQGALREIDAARALEPNQHVYHALAGVLALVSGDAEAALARLSRAVELGHEDEERVATGHLWRGRALDILGRRADAEREYRRVLGLGRDRNVDRAASRGLRQRYTRGRAARVHVDMSLADVVDP